MIIVDYSHIVIANIMADLGKDKSAIIEIDMIRHMILNSIRNYKQKFGSKYGQIIIACDGKSNWRREYFEHYKAIRRKNKEESSIDWGGIYKCMDTVKEELISYFPYPVIQQDGAEADDVIASLAKWSQSNDLVDGLFESESKPLLILSRDGDFIQLQKYGNVEQYSPIDKKFIKPTRTAELDLLEKIIRGDGGDGVPNILSDGDSFVVGKRQKSVYQKKLDVWLTQTPEEFCESKEILENFERNRTLIDFECIPNHIYTNVINSFVNYPKKDRSQLMNYFIKHRMKLLLEVIQEF